MNNTIKTKINEVEKGVYVKFLNKKEERIYDKGIVNGMQQEKTKVNKLIDNIDFDKIVRQNVSDCRIDGDIAEDIRQELKSQIEKDNSQISTGHDGEKPITSENQSEGVYALFRLINLKRCLTLIFKSRKMNL